jgi:transcriptional regulator with XRE-family HTH domain
VSVYATEPDASEARRATGAPAELGQRLRAIRVARGVGLRELARRIELSPSSISNIETGKSCPSVRTLYALASEFGVTVDEFLFDVPALRGSAETGAQEPALAVQRSVDRAAIQLDSGVRWERLMFWANEGVEFMEAIYEPGGASSPDASLVGHDGYEFGHVLSGTLHVVVGSQECVLEPGDSITFASSTPHRLSNVGRERARAIWVVRGRRGTDTRDEPNEIAR